MSSLVKHRDDQSTNEANTLQFKNIIEARYRSSKFKNTKWCLKKNSEVARKAKKKQRIKTCNLISLNSSSEFLSCYLTNRKHFPCYHQSVVYFLNAIFYICFLG